MIFDSHAHYDDEKFDIDRENLLDSMSARGIGMIVNASSSFESCISTLALTKRFPYIYGAIGIHPNETHKLDEEKFARIKEYAVKSKVVAIGEIGLDYYWKEPAPEIQKHWFERQIDLAREVELPVMIHSRDAAEDTIKILKDKKADELGGVIHCFSYGKEVLETFLDMNFYIGIGGVVTFKNAKKIKEVVEALPLDKLVVETDCPYLAPEPNRGTRNSSLNLPYIVNAIADIKGVTTREIIDITRENAKKLFGIE